MTARYSTLAALAFARAASVASREPDSTARWRFLTADLCRNRAQAYSGFLIDLDLLLEVVGGSRQGVAGVKRAR